MTLPTKILLALVIVLAGTAYANADVAAKDEDAVNFAPAATSRGPASVEAEDQSALTLRDEISDNKTEAGSCQVQCHPAFEVNPKTALGRFDLANLE